MHLSFKQSIPQLPPISTVELKSYRKYKALFHIGWKYDIIRLFIQNQEGKECNTHHLFRWFLLQNESMLTYKRVLESDKIKTYIIRADESLTCLGYTEHSFAHVIHVAETAGYILQTMGFDERTAELAKIAGYLHDIGNLVNRKEHSQSGAVMAWSLLNDMGCDPGEIATIVTAIGNHDEGTGVPVNAVAAALILADKSDVRRSRVRNSDISTFDIHDRVNYSVISSSLKINEDRTQIYLALSVDTQYGSVMDYFEIFMERMLLCKKAAEKLNLVFKFSINGQHLI